ncbi:hypothetical protein [Streptomyces sp. NPDC001089]
MSMTAKPMTAHDRHHWGPSHLLGIGLSVYTISLALYRGMSPENALSVTSTHGASRVLATVFLAAGVSIGLAGMAYVIIRGSLRPMCYIAAYVLAFATLALLRVESTFLANLANCCRYLAVSAVATGAWLSQMREVPRAHQ